MPRAKNSIAGTRRLDIDIPLNELMICLDGYNVLVVKGCHEPPGALEAGVQTAMNPSEMIWKIRRSGMAKLLGIPEIVTTIMLTSTPCLSSVRLGSEPPGASRARGFFSLFRYK